MPAAGEIFYNLTIKPPKNRAYGANNYEICQSQPGIMLRLCLVLTQIIMLISVMLIKQKQIMDFFRF